MLCMNDTGFRACGTSGVLCFSDARGSGFESSCFPPYQETAFFFFFVCCTFISLELAILGSASFSIDLPPRGSEDGGANIRDRASCAECVS